MCVCVGGGGEGVLLLDVCVCGRVLLLGVCVCVEGGGGMSG